MLLALRGVTDIGSSFVVKECRSNTQQHIVLSTGNVCIPIHCSKLEHRTILDKTRKVTWCTVAYGRALLDAGKKIKVKISLLQAVEAPRVARGRGSHIT
jgi:hypothetical protein